MSKKFKNVLLKGLNFVKFQKSYIPRSSSKPVESKREQTNES
jgi:hypothetical protein